MTDLHQAVQRLGQEADQITADAEEQVIIFQTLLTFATAKRDNARARGLRRGPEEHTAREEGMTVTDVDALLERLFWDGPVPAHELRDCQQILEHCHEEGLARRCGDDCWDITLKGQRVLSWR